MLSIDRRVQYLAYRELAAAVEFYQAKSGSLVVVDPINGEVVALAAQPSYNPNNRAGLKSENFRNRVITDVFEPGSTLKPFTIAAGLESGLYEKIRLSKQVRAICGLAIMSSMICLIMAPWI